ncbi:hypothetical protein B0H13DRAFT_2551727 [Mycena leptocephala]|nr:hypothetical protein B0H13DRAFT_2551727 [Mycena leptocephala]
MQKNKIKSEIQKLSYGRLVLSLAYRPDEDRKAIHRICIREGYGHTRRVACPGVTHPVIKAPWIFVVGPTRTCTGRPHGPTPEDHTGPHRRTHAEVDKEGYEVTRTRRNGPSDWRKDPHDTTSSYCPATFVPFYPRLEPDQRPCVYTPEHQWTSDWRGIRTMRGAENETPSFLHHRRRPSLLSFVSSSPTRVHRRSGHRIEALPSPALRPGEPSTRSPTPGGTTRRCFTLFPRAPTTSLRTLPAPSLAIP